MKYADLIKTECYNGPGWGVTFAVQGVINIVMVVLTQKLGTFVVVKNLLPIL